MADTRAPPRSRPGCARRFTARQYHGARRIDPLGGLRRHVGDEVKRPPRRGNRAPGLPTSRTERAGLRPSDRSFFSARHLSLAGGAGVGWNPVGTVSYRRQSDLRAPGFSAVGSIGDLGTLTAYRIGANRSTRRCPGEHGAGTSDEGQQSRYRSQKSRELPVPDLDSGLDSGPASRSQAGARADAVSAELDEKERLS